MCNKVSHFNCYVTHAGDGKYRWVLCDADVSNRVQHETARGETCNAVHMMKTVTAAAGSKKVYYHIDRTAHAWWVGQVKQWKIKQEVRREER